MKVERIRDSEDHITEEAVRRSATKLIPSGSVLFVTRSGILAHTFPVAVTTVEVTVNQDLKAVTPHPGVSPDYVAWGARALGGEILRRCSKDGTTVASIDTERLMGFELPVAPLPEQHRIVEAIENYFTRLDDAVATLERVQRNLKRYRASVLKAAVEGRLVPTEAQLARAEGRGYEPASVLVERILAERRRRWQVAGGRGKYQEPVTPAKGSLPDLPEGWCWTTIGGVFEVHVGATPSRARPEFWGGEIAWVSSGEVAFCRVRSTRESISEAGLEKSSTKVNPPGTILIGMIGEGRTRGQVAILDIPACNNQNAAAIRVSEVGLSPEFVYYYLMGKYQENRRLGSGNNQPALNKARVQAIPLPLAPLAEQYRIAQALDVRLSITEHLEAESLAVNVRCARLRQAILKWAFEGKVADQDSSDEPASALLERIRLETSASRQSASDADDKRRRRSGRRSPVRAERKP